MGTICGIGGWFAWQEHRPTKAIIEGLLLANESRGTDATGVAYLKSEPGIFYRKAPLTASSFLGKLGDDEWAHLIASPIGMIHARAKTKGSPKNNENNHPVVGEGWVVCHNGTLLNDDDLFDYYKNKRFAEVDSAAIPLVLSHAEDSTSLHSIVSQLTLLGGSATLAAWGTANPERVLLARFGWNDLYLFLQPDTGILYWSSAATFARYVPSYNVGGMRFLTHTKMEDDRVMVLDRSLAKSRTFKAHRNPFFFVGSRASHGLSAKTTSGVGFRYLDNLPQKGKLQAITGAGGQQYKITWAQEDQAMLSRKKPEPLLDRVGHMPNFLLVEESKTRAKRNAGQGLRHVFLTGYGKWKLFITPEGKIMRDFRFRRAVRKWIEHTLKIRSLTFPISAADRSRVDYILPMEPFGRATVEAGGAVTTNIPGFMCPWCGVHGPGHHWSTLRFRCEFCGIACNP